MSTPEKRREDILRKVRALYARAASTTFEAERDECVKKADQLMESYSLDAWMLENKDEEKAKLITKRMFNMSWWGDLGKLDWDAKSQVWHLFMTCVRHSRCYTSASIIDWSQGTPVYGLPQDLDYLDLLFTDLFGQVFAKIRPKYDPKKSLGENVKNAKEAGMKYNEIAPWSGHPEWVEYGKTVDGGRMLREYKAYLKSIGMSPRDVISVHPVTYAISFLYGFNSKIGDRFREMRKDSGSSDVGSGMALAVIDIREKAKLAMYADFPELAPHPDGCSCRDCKNSRAVVRRGRSIDMGAMGSGSAAGKDARIVSNSPGLKSQRELGR